MGFARVGDSRVTSGVAVVVFDCEDAALKSTCLDSAWFDIRYGCSVAMLRRCRNDEGICTELASGSRMGMSDDSMVELLGAGWYRMSGVDGVNAVTFSRLEVHGGT